MPAVFKEKPRYFVIMPIDSEYCIQLAKDFRDGEIGHYRLRKQCGAYTKPGIDRVVIDFVIATMDFLQAVRAARVRTLFRRDGGGGSRRRGPVHHPSNTRT